MKKFLLLFILGALLISGCSSGSSYNPPEPGDPRAYITVVNNCDFVLYIEIDGAGAGSLNSDKSTTIEVTPALHNFRFYGTYDDSFEQTYIPLYFKTSHTFTEGEVYNLPVEFGVR